MNLNELFVTEFSEHIGYPVAEDIYEDDESDIYFTFSMRMKHRHNLVMTGPCSIQLIYNFGCIHPRSSTTMS